MKQVYLISGWVVAACAVLSLILYAVAERGAGATYILGTICEVAFLGITATLALLYFADNIGQLLNRILKGHFADIIFILVFCHNQPSIYLFLFCLFITSLSIKFSPASSVIT
jgi:hypothetical protein